jgi:hypothetical protein
VPTDTPMPNSFSPGWHVLEQTSVSTSAVAQWTWALWHDEQTEEEQEREEQRVVFYVDGQTPRRLQ